MTPNNAHRSRPEGPNMTSTTDSPHKELHRTNRIVWTLCLITVLSPLSFGQVSAADAPARAADSIRVATFNVSLNRRGSGQLKRDLTGEASQIRSIAAILRTVRPDIVLLNEFDQSDDAEAVKLFQQRFLNSKGKAEDGSPIHYPYVYAAPVNTGQPSGLDLDQNGRTGDPGDNFGFGFFPGQYAMVVLSRYPIATDQVRTFQKFLWHRLPDAAAPLNEDGEPWYPNSVWKQLRLSSKSHWDVPILINGQTLHLLACHPTPPAFDGPEARNQRRNHDEIRLWAEYISGSKLPWLQDDQGREGGLADDARFVIVGDLNADPSDGNSYHNAARLLLEHPRILAAPVPGSEGGRIASEQQGGVNSQHTGDAAADTADFSDRSVGNLRVDYVLPSTGLRIAQSGVFWPAPDAPLSKDARVSDHRLVWVDVRMAD